MCGICGLWNPKGSDALTPVTIDRMTDALAHRGPDDRGTWQDGAAGIAMGHRRLAVLDLSAAGHQPMASPAGRYVTVYNGEIYNFAALRAELEAQRASPEWRGQSDTEVVLAGFDYWGIEGTLGRANGMFALAVWDRETRTLTLARDRFGEKPLYYGFAKGVFLFGSELKALQCHPAFSAQIDPDALGAFLRYGYVPAPHSIWCGISKLPPGSLVTVAAGGTEVSDPQAYWSLSAAVQKGAEAPLEDDKDARDTLEMLLRDAVSSRSLADVPLGAFLSGGVDSSLITTLLQQQSSRPVKTFTIGFTDPQFDEAPYARAISRHLGTEHHELYVDARQTTAMIPGIAEIWDEPFSDSSQVPTYLVSKLAREQVTVALSGDAGDELFGGYNRYLAGASIAKFARRLPAAARPTIARAVRARSMIALGEAVNAALPMRRRQLGLSDRMHKAADTILDPRPDAMYRRLVSHADAPTALLRDPREYHHAAVVPDALTDPRSVMMYLDTMTYLPDDILTKVDRASMAIALEARVPFLDHRVVEFAWRLPMSAKIRGNVGKDILREILYRHVPRTLIDRPKAGFAAPVAEWLKGPLRDWGETLIDSRRLDAQGLFDVAAVRTLWADAMAGRRAAHTQLWDVLMFQAWWDNHRCAPEVAEVAMKLAI